jgi:hypothetical protein
MRRFWRRADEGLVEMDGELRARRSDAPRDFVRALAGRARPEPHGRLRPGVRLALTFALVGGGLIAVASAGGFSEMTATTSHTVKTVVHRIIAPAKPQAAKPIPVKPNVLSPSLLKPNPGPPPPPADDQYKKQCGPSPSKQCKARIDPRHRDVKEGNIGDSNCVSFDVRLDKPSASSAVTVTWATQDGSATAGQDYFSAGSTLVFNQGVKSQSISVCTKGDNVDEKNEKFKVTLTSGTFANVSGPDTTSDVEIKDDDHH